jgi:hypothetical protein
MKRIYIGVRLGTSSDPSKKKVNARVKLKHNYEDVAVKKGRLSFN